MRNILFKTTNSLILLKLCYAYFSVKKHWSLDFLGFNNNLKKGEANKCEVSNPLKANILI